MVIFAVSYFGLKRTLDEAITASYLLVKLAMNFSNGHSGLAEKLPVNNYFLPSSMANTTECGQNALSSHSIFGVVVT